MIEKFYNALFGCKHKRLTRPITPVHRPGTPSSATYVACLECGRRFHYDTLNMQVGTAMPAGTAAYRAFSPFQVQ